MRRHRGLGLGSTIVVGHVRCELVGTIWGLRVVEGWISSVAGGCNISQN